jgi:hypothetical protein
VVQFLKRPVTLDPDLPSSQPPPLCTKTFYSDAAGFPKRAIWKSNIVCGVVGLNESTDTCLAFQLWWPMDFITNKTDNKGSRFGDKTTTFEQIGILLPLLLIPNEFKNQHIVFKTDNLACLFGHSNKGMKNDACASILIKSVQLICAFLGSVAHVIHMPCRSDWASDMADNLSRESTTGFLETQILNRHLKPQTPMTLLEWLQNPIEDWELPFNLLNYAENKYPANLLFYVWFEFSQPNIVHSGDRLIFKRKMSTGSAVHLSQIKPVSLSPIGWFE